MFAKHGLDEIFSINQIHRYPRSSIVLNELIPLVMNGSQGLAQSIESCLPRNEKFQVLQLQSLPKQTHPLVRVDEKSEKAPLTVKVQHFFSLFHHEKVIFALEIYVFLTLHEADVPAERLLFISKVDTSAYSDIRVSFKNITKNLIEYVLSIDPNYYLKKVRPRIRNCSKEANLLTRRTGVIESLRILSKRSYLSLASPSIPNNFYLSLKFPRDHITRISLFTRPEPQYLFAGSSKNKRKHCLNGSQLLKWWLSILDDILCEDFQVNTEAKIQIPGEDSAQIKRYLKNVRFASWQVGDIFSHGKEELASSIIPSFPDDPKSRYLHQLVEEDRIHATNMVTFWTELAQRQEFRLSVVVSVLGIHGRLSREPSHWPTFPLDQDQDHQEIYIADSKKQFNFIKSYITGEEYDTEEGALEAFENIRDLFKIRLNRLILSIAGAKDPDAIDADRSQRRVSEPKRINVITSFRMKKKPKKSNQSS